MNFKVQLTAEYIPAATPEMEARLAGGLRLAMTLADEFLSRRAGPRGGFTPFTLLDPAGRDRNRAVVPPFSPPWKSPCPLEQGIGAKGK